MSEVDKQTFGAKRDWLKRRIDNYYYGPQNYGQFVEDVNASRHCMQSWKPFDNVSTMNNQRVGCWYQGMDE